MRRTERSISARAPANSRSISCTPLQRGEIIAIQGDRVTPVIHAPGDFFGKPARVSAGPFALAMAARVPVYPLFIVRMDGGDTDWCVAADRDHAQPRSR